MKLSIHTLYWDNIDRKIADAHAKVMYHFGVPVVYTKQNINHYDWMDSILTTSDADIIGFIDIDCVPVSLLYYYKILELAKLGYIVGPAQSTNCIPDREHIFAAPSFLFVPRKAYNYIGKPSCKNNNRSDCAQEITRAAENNKYPYRLLYPTKFEKPAGGGLWRLGNYGYFGIGTVYGDNGLYHLFQSRLSENVDLFVKRCDEIIKGTFDSTNFMSSTDEYYGKLQIENG